MSDVSVIGLGTMGGALARTQLAFGRDVTVWNRTAEKMAPLLATGAKAADRLGEAPEASDVSIVCIMTHADTRALLAPTWRGGP